MIHEGDSKEVPNIELKAKDSVKEKEISVEKIGEHTWESKAEVVPP